MKRKVCFVLAILTLLLWPTAFAVQATQDGDTQWALVNYTQVPDVEGETGKSGTLSFQKDAAGKDAKTYLTRYTTLSWDATVLEVSVQPISKKSLTVDITVSDGVGSCYLFWAGEYTVTVKKISGGESVSCLVTLLPVVKMSDEYLSANATLGKFWRSAYHYYPTIVCENVDKIELDRSDFPSGTNMESFLRARDKNVFGEHVLKFTNGTYAISVYIDMFACLAEKKYDESLGKYALVLNVGDFGEDYYVMLDNNTELAPGEHKITAVGQHTLDLKHRVGNTVEKISNASPPPQQLNLQVQLILEDLTLDEPIVLQFSRWDATFCVNGEVFDKEAGDGNYRVARDGKHKITVLNEKGEVMENAFLVQTVSAESGAEYTELVLEFDNPHSTYVIFLIIPAVLMVAVVIFFFLRRRRIV